MNPLSRDMFLNAPAASKREKVEIPALGGYVYVRQLTAGERDALENQIRRRKGKNARAQIVAFVAVDEQGNRLFTQDDVPRLSDLPVAALEPILDAQVKLNGMSDDDLEDLEKN